MPVKPGTTGSIYTMTQITLDPAKSNIAVQVTSQSLHALGFEITVFAADGTTVTEQFTGDTKINPFKKSLVNPSSEYKGCFICTTITVLSPDGTDYPYSILFSIVQDDIFSQPNMLISGITGQGCDTTGGTYHIN